MHSICGIYNLNKETTEPNMLNEMLGVLAVSRNDVACRWQSDFIALGSVEHHPLLQTGLKINSGIETQNGSCVTGISRIYNKEELFDKLSIPGKRRATISDNLLFLKCFEKWKYDCPNQILGEWVFVLWNNEKKELFIASSHFWKPNLYYYRSSKAFYFSSSLKALLALDQIPKEINEFRFGQLLIGWNNNLGNTLYKNIYPLKPAHTLKITADSFEENRYWALEDTPPIRFKTDNEYVENFKELYTEAVRCRLVESEVIGSTLSGGLDSGSVTALAAMELKKQGKTLQTFSSIPVFDVTNFPNQNRFGNETEFINATANYAGNVKLNFIKSESLSPLQGIKKSISLLEEPPGNAINLYWLFSTLQNVQNNDIDTLLIGQTGNLTVSWKGMFSGFIDWTTFIKNINENGITNFSNVLRSVKTYLVEPFIPSGITNKRKRKNNIQINWGKYSPINNYFAEKQNFSERMQESGHYDYSKNPRINQLRMIKPFYGTTAPFWSEIGRQYNVWITDPTADKRILEFCTSIPNDQFYRKGIEKYLYKRAMKGILPEKVIWNTQRGQQAADLQQRLISDLPEIKSIIETIRKSEICNYYLDGKKIESAIPFLEQNSMLAFQMTGSVLLRGIAFGLFLQKFD